MAPIPPQTDPGRPFDSSPVATVDQTPDSIFSMRYRALIRNGPLLWLWLWLWLLPAHGRRPTVKGGSGRVCGTAENMDVFYKPPW
jgi:hypothetical protein